MAVQAQYSSNVLLLNRNTQEQQQTGGGGGGVSPLFDHQPHLPFNSGVGNNNNRKRSRELISAMNSSGSLMALQQSHTSNVVSTGLRLAFTDQLHHQIQQQQQLSLLPSQSSQKSSTLIPFSSQDLASHINQQRQEIENFITIQGEQFRRASAEKRRRNFRSLLIAAESSISRQLSEKQAELDKAARLNSELESQAAQLSGEVQAWQARAREQEALAAALHAEINQIMLNDGGGNGCAEDAESGCIDPDRVGELNGPSCRGCGGRVALMVLLPCRHLCLCRECDGVAKCCPLCYTFRSSSVEVVMG